MQDFLDFSYNNFILLLASEFLKSIWIFYSFHEHC